MEEAQLRRRELHRERPAPGTRVSPGDVHTLPLSPLERFCFVAFGVIMFLILFGLLYTGYQIYATSGGERNFHHGQNQPHRTQDKTISLNLPLEHSFHSHDVEVRDAK